MKTNGSINPEITISVNVPSEYAVMHYNMYATIPHSSNTRKGDKVIVEMSEKCRTVAEICSIEQVSDSHDRVFLLSTGEIAPAIYDGKLEHGQQAKEQSEAPTPTQ